MREEIIKMAREAGAFLELSTTPEKDMAFLERFFHMAQAAERKKVAEEIFDMCKEGWWDSEGMRHHWNKRGQA